MRRVAQQIGIRAPRIYKHLPHKETLQAAISTPTPRRCTARRLAMVIASRFLPPASATADRHSPGFPDARDRDAKFAIACSPSTPPPFLERNSHDAPSTLPSRAAPPAQREPLSRPAPRTRTDTNAGLGTVDDVRPANRPISRLAMPDPGVGEPDRPGHPIVARPSENSERARTWNSAGRFRGIAFWCRPSRCQAGLVIQ